MHYSILLAACGAFTSSHLTLAQAPGTAPAPSVVAGAPVAERSAEQMARDYLVDENLVDGINGEFFVSIGVSQLRCLGDSPDFDMCLRMSFVEALLDAKKKMAKYLESEISSEFEARAKAGSATLEAVDGSGSIANRAAMDVIGPDAAQLEPEIAAQMRSDGKDVDSPAGKHEVRKTAFRKAAAALLGTDEIRSRIAIVSRAEVAGIYAKKSFASTKGKGDVAVVCMLTPRGLAMVKAILGKGPAPAGTTKESIPEWARSVGDDKLAFMFGVQPRSDEKGNLSLVGFGQASAAVESPVLIKQAKARARVYAQAAIREFAGELVASAELESASQDSAALADATTRINSDRAYSESITARAEKLSISGITEVYSWEIPHPLSGQATYGVVMSWNLSESKAANQLRETVRAIEGSKGGIGATKQMPSRGPTGTQPSNERKNSGEGVPSDHDDD